MMEWDQLKVSRVVGEHGLPDGSFVLVVRKIIESGEVSGTMESKFFDVPNIERLRTEIGQLLSE